jgi:hypothetical protein
MKDKRLNILSTLFVVLLLVVTVSAATINTPVASTSVTETILVNVTSHDAKNGPVNFVNITIYAQSATSANTSWITIATNQSLNLSKFLNTSINSVNLSYGPGLVGLLEDAHDYIFNATITYTNGTFITDDTNIGITIDNTIPIAPSSLTSGSQTTQTPTLSSTVTGSKTTQCTLYYTQAKPGATRSESMTHTLNSCSDTTVTLPEGTYRYLVAASDGTNTTNSSEATIQVSVNQGGGSYVPPQNGGSSQDEDNSLMFTIIGAIALVVLVLWFRK